jgi:hypothetical protein
LQNNFEIVSAPLWKIAYLDGYSDGSARVFFALHHLIIDAVSWRILIEDLKYLLETNADDSVNIRVMDNQRVSELPAKGSSYRQWVTEVKEYALKHSDEEDYWQSVIENIPDYNHYLPQEKNSSKTKQTKIRHSVNSSSFSLDRESSKVLLQQANQAYHSEINDLLLTALAYSLEDWNIEAAALDKYPLSFAQERLWFIEQYEGGSNAYHIPLLLELSQTTDLLILKQR